MNTKDSQESENERKRLGLTDRDIQDAQRLLYRIANLGSAQWPEKPLDGRYSRAQLLQRARRELENRRRRAQQFPRSMFGEPAWDMLLVLYVTDGCAPETIRGLRELAGLTHTTALRWLDYLEAQQLITRKPHPTDKRSAFIELSAKASERLDRYFSDLLTTE